MTEGAHAEPHEGVLRAAPQFAKRAEWQVPGARFRRSPLPSPRGRYRVARQREYVRGPGDFVDD